MKARPILFSGAMVRALLAGTKTQTRRIVKGVPLDWLDDAGFTPAFVADPDNGLCPYGVPGDLLWVKERLARSPDLWTYVADGTEVGWPARGVLAGKRLDYAPSIHMPKVASRLTLRITEVRIERLQDISEADADAECFGGGFPDVVLPEVFGPRESGWGHLSIPECYGRLWEHINGVGSWDANPWVWAVSFEVLHQNVETALQPNAAAPAAHSPVIDGESSRAEPLNSYPTGRDQ